MSTFSINFEMEEGKIMKNIGSGKSAIASENTPLHNSMYDYNDDISELGAEFFAELIKVRLVR